MEFIDLKSQQALIRKDLQERMDKVLAHGQYIMGPEIAESEKALCEFSGAKHAITCASGTDALLMCMMALNLKPGDEVITTTFTFYATVGMMVYLGVKPVLVDIDPRTCNIDVNQIENKITSKTKVILPVSLYGQCADMDRINALAQKHGIEVIEDAAQSFGARQRGKWSCNLTKLSCTSFFPAKPLGVYGDGGACFTNNDQLAHDLRAIRVHGSHERYNHVRIGINGRFDTLQAAILISKLRVFPGECESRERIGRQYNELFEEYCPSVKTPVTEEFNRHVYAQYTLRVPQREKVMAMLKDHGVPTVVHYPKSIHNQKVFSDLYGQFYNDQKFPEAEKAAQEVMSLPMHPYLKKEDQVTVVKAVAAVLKEIQ